VLDQVKWRRLKQASTDDDWIVATDVALELSLESKGTMDEFYVEQLERIVRLQDAEGLTVIIDYLVVSN